MQIAMDISNWHKTDQTFLLQSKKPYIFAHKSPPHTLKQELYNQAVGLYLSQAESRYMQWISKTNLRLETRKISATGKDYGHHISKANCHSDSYNRYPEAITWLCDCLGQFRTVIYHLEVFTLLVYTVHTV